MRSRAFLLLLFLSGCSVYQNGSIDQTTLAVGRSVSDIDRYIEETAEGPNIYLDRDRDDCLMSSASGCGCERQKVLRVFVEGHEVGEEHIHAGYINIPVRG